MYNNGYSPNLIKIVYDLILKPAENRMNFNQLYDTLNNLIHWFFLFFFTNQNFLQKVIKK